MGELKGLTQASYRDSLTGRTVHSIEIPGGSVRHHGYSVNEWTSDTKKIVVNVIRDSEKSANLCDIVLFDTGSGDSVVLQSNVAAGSGTLAYNDMYFYRGGIYNSKIKTDTFCHQIYAVDLNTLKKQKIFDEPYAVTIDCPLSVTDDGKMLGIATGVDKRIISTINTETCEIKKVFNQTLTPIFDEKPIHVQINPKDPQYILFCRGGAVCMADWIWVLDAKHGTTENIFKHQLMKDGRNGEDIGHELWSHDGEWVYFVKYIHSLHITGEKPAGIYRVSKTGEKWEYVNGDYDYWHLNVSPNGRFVTADVRPINDITKIVVVDLQTRRSQILCEFEVVAHAVWGHPHPTFSPDSKKVSFFYLTPGGTQSVGYVEL